MTDLTSIFKLLSDETRLRMLLLLFQEDLCVCELAGIIGSPQPRISKNLSKLRDMMLVTDARKEKYVFYHLKTENEILMRTLQSILDDIDQFPVLAKDSAMLDQRDQYMSICQINA
ncbi:ArsR/SmtB family transcription factor [Fusibacter tunisiensis]|uniref:ArsR family transcriptional regulator n=1 Tax=Fusibacter tunisiensis TaxID=1008308 RepID=A0ABS2MTA9_9FIRM|nr:metalloregulator ArsR/SmtB family transcription factor [Fusibacter tunisiensis]MBM7562676.1 ArsR family transcriptional regulator [Fusibacter tunisiensis]